MVLTLVKSEKVIGTSSQMHRGDPATSSILKLTRMCLFHSVDSAKKWQSRNLSSGKFPPQPMHLS